MVSTPCAASDSWRPGVLKRATPITRRPGAALRASRASVGPIFPPTPRTRMSPSTPSKIGDQIGRRPTEERFELLDASESFRGDWDSGSHCILASLVMQTCSSPTTYRNLSAQ